MEHLLTATVDVDMISSHMFYNSPTLRTVVVGDDVWNPNTVDADDSSTWVVGDNAFSKCPSITSVTINNNTIGDYMFAWATSLETVVIPLVTQIS